LFSKGSITIGQIRGAPIRVHWTTLLGALVFTRSLNPAVWLAFFLLVVVHELGHAACVRFCGYRVTAIDVNGLGGLCHWEGDPTAKHDALIAWGGVIAQAVVLVASLMVLAVADLPPSLAGVAWVLTEVNATMMILNLVPIPPLDGARAWPLLRILAEERGWWTPTYGEPGSRPRRAWSRSAEWLKDLSGGRARREAERRRKARAAVEKELRDLEAIDEEEAPPIPGEVGEVIDRTVGKGRSSSPKKDPPEQG